MKTQAKNLRAGDILIGSQGGRATIIEMHFIRYTDKNQFWTADTEFGIITWAPDVEVEIAQRADSTRPCPGCQRPLPPDLDVCATCAWLIEA